MKRGGQHGIINWFAQQNHHDSLHLNNCIKGWEQQKLIPMKEHMVVHYKFNGAGHDIKNYFVDHKIDLDKSQQLRREFYQADFNDAQEKLYNIEDLSIAEYNERKMWNFGELANNSKTFLILRDPFNFIASCLQRLKNPPDEGARDVGIQLPQRLAIWKEHAYHILNGGATTRELHFINFNEWFLSEEYRKSLCDKHSLVFTDHGVNKIMNFGNGSSFDREKFDGEAQKMNVLTRYKDWENHKAFQHLIDDEITYLAEKIFDLKRN
tara:strand:+ start:767 stop:1564 length:798 start_codon:yes stop_codon:yes gene_type:complete